MLGATLQVCVHPRGKASSKKHFCYEIKLNGTLEHSYFGNIFIFFYQFLKKFHTKK